MKRGTCATCAYFVDARKECRLNPPTILVISPRRDTGNYGISREKFESGWPTVDGDDWCSHWKTALVGGVRKTNPEQLSEEDNDG